MVHRGASRRRAVAIPTLKKADVERLLAGYDDDPSGAVGTALRIVLGMPDATWEALIEVAPFDTGRRALLLAHDEGALDSLAAELNERRTL